MHLTAVLQRNAKSWLISHYHVSKIERPSGPDLTRRVVIHEFGQREALQEPSRLRLVSLDAQVAPIEGVVEGSSVEHHGS